MYEKTKAPAWGAFCTNGGSRLVVEYKRDFQLDPVLGDIAVFVDLHILILDPGGFDVPERFYGSCNTLTNGIVKALSRRCFNFAYSGNGHRILLYLIQGIS